MAQESRDEGPSEGPGPDPRGESVLRAKYFDYCSARISDVFLSLSDERIYELMEEAALESGMTPGSLGFRAMVGLVTRKLKKSVPLPEFETWAAEYREHPERYDPLLMGLWRTAADRPAGPEASGPSSAPAEDG